MVDKLKYKLGVKSKYDVYDEPGTIHSLLGTCLFCRIVSKDSPTKSNILFRDEKICIF